MKKRYKALLILGIVFIGIPVILWLSWLLSTPKPISIFIMDKTSYPEQRIKHRAVNLVLKHYRFVKHNGKDYLPDLDYYGFYPVDSARYTIRDLSNMTPSDIQRLALQYDAAYYADIQGVYSNMWPEYNEDITPVRKLYGGLEWHDLLFLEYMILLDRLVITESVFLSPPTQPTQREQIAELLGVEWQGWKGRFFHTLDKDHPDKVLPGWIPLLYEASSGLPWSFKNAGVILVHEDETLLVFEQNQHLGNPQLLIRTQEDIRDIYGVSDKISYPGWFDVTLPNSPSAEVLSWYELDLTQEGLELLRQYNLPEKFPAVIHNNGNGNIYYFAGDFGQNPISNRFVKFKGSRYAELFLADLNDPTDKSGFFLAFYLPLVKNILADYQDDIITE